MHCNVLIYLTITANKELCLLLVQKLRTHSPTPIPKFQYGGTNV